MKEVLKKIGNNIFDVVFAVIMIGGVICLIGYFVGLRPFIVVSGSMEPIIQTGSVCVVNTNEDYNDIKVGDVVSYRKASSLIIHRVIAITDEGMETKGDNNDTTDGISTTYENFGGKVLFSIPYLGYIINWVRNPHVLVVIVGIIISILLLGIINQKYGDGDENADAQMVSVVNDITEENKGLQKEEIIIPVKEETINPEIRTNGSEKSEEIARYVDRKVFKNQEKKMLPEKIQQKKINKQQYVRYSTVTVLAIGVAVGVSVFKKKNK